MPQIPPELLKCTFYLYKTAAEGRAGKNYGGTGFLLGVRSAIDRTQFHTFGVTNWHVAVRDGYSIARINTKSGAPEIFKFEPSEWSFRRDWHDIAIVPLQVSDARHDVAIIVEDMALSEETVKRLQIGPGDSVFMVGRFVDHDGGVTNIPSARFGNISMMPEGLIEQPTRVKLPSYVLDVHSRTGYSGSPVIAYRTAGDVLRVPGIRQAHGEPFVGLLGVHWGQFPEKWKVTAKGKAKPSREGTPRRFIGEAEIEGLSGMTCAAPAWVLRDLLANDPKLQRYLAQREDAVREQRAGKPPPPVVST